MRRRLNRLAFQEFLVIFLVDFVMFSGNSWTVACWVISLARGNRHLTLQSILIENADNIIAISYSELVSISIYLSLSLCLSFPVD